VKGIDVKQFRPVKLTEGDKLYTVGQSMTVAGWGTTALNGPTPGVLLEAPGVPFVSQVECEKTYGSYLTDNMFCAGERLGTIRNDQASLTITWIVIV
jgi:hypothetical protein